MMENLRPAIVKLVSDADKKKYGDVASGLFHRYADYSEDGLQDTWALVEMIDGCIIETYPSYVQFVNSDTVKEHLFNLITDIDDKNGEIWEDKQNNRENKLHNEIESMCKELKTVIGACEFGDVSGFVVREILRERCKVNG